MLLNYEMLKESLYSYKAKDNKIKRMCEKKEIIKLTKNLYETNINIEGYLVANAIYSPSYLSFDYALSYYNLIPEMTKIYTSATYNKNKTKKYINDVGVFTYRDIPKKAYPFGIVIIQEGQYSYQIASKEKAICDKLYTLKPVNNKKELIKLLFIDLRIDYDEFKLLDFNNLNSLCDLYNCKNLKLLKKVVGDINGNNIRTND